MDIYRTVETRLQEDDKLINHSSLDFPVNVCIRHLDADSGKVLSRQYTHNRVLKYFGLYSWFRFIQNDFFNNSIRVDPSYYIPKYLAVGTNSGVRTGPSGTSTVVNIEDTGLYHEVKVDTTGQGRIPITSQNLIEDRAGQDYLKITYIIDIPKDRFVNETIGELGLMTTKDQDTAFARVTGFDPITKIPNTIVQVIWEISVRSIETLNDPYRPVSKQHLLECIDAGVRVLREQSEDPENWKIGQSMSITSSSVLLKGSTIATGSVLDGTPYVSPQILSANLTVSSGTLSASSIIIGGSTVNGKTVSLSGARRLLQFLISPYTQVGSAQFYLYDTTSTQDQINGLINRPFDPVDLKYTGASGQTFPTSGLVDTINLFESWQPSNGFPVL